jgi:aromatic-L-amino-acid decarboxylase
MAHQLVEFIAEYYTKLLAQPSSIRVQPPPTLSPGFLRSKLPNTAPDGPESFEAVLRDIEDLILPGLLHWQHPNFYGYFSHSHSFPGILADLLSSAFGTLGFQWTSSPSMTELEITVLDWLVHLLRLPSFYNSSAKDGAGAALQSSASEAVLISMVAARARSLSDLSAEDSIRLVAYCSDQAHSCVQKAAMVAGIINVRVLPTQPEEEYALNPSLLGTAIQKDLQDGLIPFWAASTIGTTSSCAVDPVSDLADVCGQSRVW